MLKDISVHRPIWMGFEAREVNWTKLQFATDACKERVVYLGRLVQFSFVQFSVREYVFYVFY